jgi:hypothetical protein
MRISPNRIATYLAAAAGAATAISVPLGNLDATSISGVVTGLAAIFGAFVTWMVGWQKHEERMAAVAPLLLSGTEEPTGYVGADDSPAFAVLPDEGDAASGQVTRMTLGLARVASPTEPSPP